MENFIFCAVTFLDAVDHGGVIERRYNYFFREISIYLM